jgi:uncharacterized protein
METEVVRCARRAKLAGLTVFEAKEGFGSSGQIHQSHLVTGEAPLAIVVIDSKKKIEEFVESISDLLMGVQIVLEEVELLEL